MLAEALALLSAATSGISVISVRRHSARSSVFNMSLVITTVGMLVLWPLTLAESRFRDLTLWSLALFAVSGLLSPGLVRLFYYKGMKQLGASVNSSIFAIYPLYALLPAIFLLNEKITVYNLVGILAIIAGIILIERLANGKKGQMQLGWKGLVIPGLGGLMLGGATVFRKLALDISPAPILGVAIAYVFSLMPYLLTLAAYQPTRRDLSLKKNIKYFWAAGIGQAISWLLAFYALSGGQIAITTPLLAVEPIFVVAFAYFYLKKVEYISVKLAASIALTVLGVALIAI
jgi:DME family drug/metabolite transporter